MKLFNKIALNTVFFIGIFCSIPTYSALPPGKLYIRNDNPGLNFTVKYKDRGTEKEIIARYGQQAEPLGLLINISDLKIARYGKWTGWGAQFTSYETLLNECKAQPNEDCTLVITTGRYGWDVTKSTQAEQTAHAVLQENPAEMFIKKDEPRYILGLQPGYTRQQADDSYQRLVQQYKTYPDSPQKQRMIELLQQAAAYAKALLDKPSGPEREKLLLEWKSKLQLNRIAQGKTIACTILHNHVPQLSQADYLNQIIDLMWYFYSLAVNKHQAFEEGTFIIEDTNNKFYNFLMKYVKLVNPTIKDSLDDPAAKQSWNTYGYSRLSSHFKLEQKQNRHYGIDMRYPQAYRAEALLPTGKYHILFGRIASEKIFVKFEKAGITPRDVLFHATDFVIAQTRKLIPGLKSYMDQYLPELYSDTLVYYIGIDDDPNYRKERIPHEFINQCLQILQSGKLSEEVIKQYITEFATQGIKRLHQIVQNPPANLTTVQQAFSTYLQELQRIYDNIPMRYGREVILTQQELKQQCR